MSLIKLERHLIIDGKALLNVQKKKEDNWRILTWSWKPFDGLARLGVMVVVCNLLASADEGELTFLRPLLLDFLGPSELGGLRPLTQMFFIPIWTAKSTFWLVW